MIKKHNIHRHKSLSLLLIECSNLVHSLLYATKGTIIIIFITKRGRETKEYKNNNNNTNNNEKNNQSLIHII